MLITSVLYAINFFFIDFLLLNYRWRLEFKKEDSLIEAEVGPGTAVDGGGNSDRGNQGSNPNPGLEIDSNLKILNAKWFISSISKNKIAYICLISISIC